MINPTIVSTMPIGKDGMPKRPTRPLSAYNLFFHVERQRIIDGTDHLPLDVSAVEVRDIINKHKAKTKRVHRKTHGKISFQELNATIAMRWKKLSGSARCVLEEQAKIEKEDHLQRVVDWQEKRAIQENMAVPSRFNLSPLQREMMMQHQQEATFQDLLNLRSHVDAMVSGSNMPPLLEGPRMVSPPADCNLFNMEPLCFFPCDNNNSSSHMMGNNSASAPEIVISSSALQRDASVGYDLLETISANDMDNIFGDL